MEHLRWGPVAQGLVGPLVVVEQELGAQFPPGSRGVGVSFQVHLLEFTVRHNRSIIKVLSVYRPFPPMLIFTPRSCRTWVNFPLVNWLPWSVLNTSGRPCRNASCKASTHKPASRIVNFQGM